MSHVRTLCFDHLEARKLLTKVHHGAVHKAAAVVAVPLVLDGTLTVNNKDAMQNMDTGTATTTSTAVPIAGKLGSLGHVTGVWEETTDEYGDYLGPDMLLLHSSQGSFIVAFNDATSGPSYKNSNGTIYYQHDQHTGDPTGAFAGESESGTLNLNMNHARTEVESITLDTTSS